MSSAMNHAKRSRKSHKRHMFAAGRRQWKSVNPARGLMQGIRGGFRSPRRTATERKVDKHGTEC